MNTYNKCTLCARKCGIDRSKTVGFCKMGTDMTVVRAALHMWEEPCISGERGSGTIFFVGCSLGCAFCQNREISTGCGGVAVSEEELAEVMLRLEREGAHNVNFVTPTHFAPGVKNSLIIARGRGLSIPAVYNTGSYDGIRTLKMLDGAVDVYLADFKFYLPKTAKLLSCAEDYPEVVKSAISEMVRQRPTPIIEDGIMKSGVIVRILLLPAHVAEAKLTLKYLYDTYGDSIYISLMNQYTPMPNIEKPLNRKVTRAEYEDLLSYAERLGVKNAYYQEWGTADESYIPPFDNTGVNLK